MKINFDALMLDAEGQPFPDGDVKVGLTRAVLSNKTAEGTDIPADEKLARFELYLKLRTATNDTDWSLDEVQLLVKAVKVFPTLVMGQLTYLLNQKTV